MTPSTPLPPPPPDVAPVADPVVPTGDDQTGDDQAGDDPAVERRSRALVLVPLVVGVAAAAVVGLLAVRGLRRDTGGASSADKAVQTLARSVSSGDWAAAADVMAPDETYDLKGLIAGARHAAAAGRLTTQPSSNGLDVKLDLTNAAVTALGPDAARIDIEGTARWSPASTIGPVLQHLIGPSSASRSISTVDATVTTSKGVKVPPFMIAVRRGTRWYVSPALTSAEYARQLLDLPAGDYTAIRAPQAAGSPAATPSAAIDNVLAAVASQDVDALTASLASGEARVARVYRAAIDQLVKRGELARWSIVFDHLRTRAGTRSDSLEVTGLDVTAGSRAGTKTSVSFDGSCSSTSGGRRQCYWLTDDVGTRLGVARPQLRVVKEGGSWKFSPFASVVDVTSTAAGKADAPLLAALLGTEVFDDGQPVNLDEPVTVSFADKPYAVYDVAVAAGDVISWEARGGDVAIYDKRADGGWQRITPTDLGLVPIPTATPAPAPSPFAQTYRALAATTRRFVVTAPTECHDWWRGCFMGVTTKPATFVVHHVSTQDIVFPGVAKGHLDPGQSILLGFAVAQDTTWVPALSGSVGVQVSGPVPVTVAAASAGPIALKAGRYESLVTNTGESAADFSLGFTELVTFGFDTGPQDSVTVDGTTPARVQLHLQAGKAWNVTATPPETMDIRLQVIDYDGTSVACSFDDHPVGQPEVCQFRPAPRDGVVTVVVVPTNGVAGAVTVTAAQS